MDGRVAEEDCEAEEVAGEEASGCEDGESEKNMKFDFETVGGLRKGDAKICG